MLAAGRKKEKTPSVFNSKRRKRSKRENSGENDLLNAKSAAAD